MIFRFTLSLALINDYQAVQTFNVIFLARQSATISPKITKRAAASLRHISINLNTGIQEYCWLGLSIPLGEEKFSKSPSSGLNFTVVNVDREKTRYIWAWLQFQNKTLETLRLMFTVCSRKIQSTCILVSSPLFGFPETRETGDINVCTTCIHGCRSYFFSARAFCEYWQFWQCHKTCSVQHSRHKVFMIFFGETEMKRTNTQERWCCQYPCGLPGVHRRSATQTQQDFSTAD